MIQNSLLLKRRKDELVAKLSLISLMDIFTILVFFLMLNSGETQNIETVKAVDLPNSSSGKSPHTDLTVYVSEEHIIFDEREIAQVAEVLETPEDPIEALQSVLKAQKELMGEDEVKLQEKIGHAITIQADKDVDYELLKVVMETCQLENFRNISLAVNRVQEIPLGSPESAAASVASISVTTEGEG
ncbi:ExbD/TolR family protein [Agaribacterium haliotis]|uniref:ExbD/TolR family protein n=1 Tax=Agaribacterium haliotis TaxID=2013869 RepID=UPI000BB54136|nr:biopolymer transporter ExbD [Agaribacterium haliotis]